MILEQMTTSIVYMTLDQWIAVPTHPRQRDTERHAYISKRKHLKHPDPTHSIVYAAKVNGRIVFKLDGHTRAFLWARGELATNFERLTVICYHAPDLEAAKELYYRFDNRDAVETSCDLLSGACRECGIVLTSHMLRTYKWVSALKYAEGYDKTSGREAELVRKYARELRIMDSWGLPRLHTSIMATVFILLRDNAPKVHEFCAAYAANAGRKEGTLSDGVEALRRYMQQCTTKGTMAGSDNVIGHMERVYTAYAAYRDGRYLNTLRASKRAAWDKNAPQEPRRHYDPKPQ